MAITSNPTKTRRIEKNWEREINRRWRVFRTLAVSRLETMSRAALPPVELSINQDDPFVMSPSQQRVYMAFLEAEIARLLLVTPDAPNWQAQYQIQSYQRGLETTRAALLAQGAGVIPTEVERLRALGITTFTAVPALGVTLIGGAPIHQEALAFLTTRSYDKLKGWTDALANETRQILFDGVAEGQGINEVVRNMVDRIEVSRTRARVIARTEINQAFSRSSIVEAQRASIEIDEDVNLRWLSVRDSLVRHLHATFHGQVMTPEEASRKKNISPWNCRCGFAPVIPEADTETKREKFNKERKQLLALEKRTAKAA